LFKAYSELREHGTMITIPLYLLLLQARVFFRITAVVGSAGLAYRSVFLRSRRYHATCSDRGHPLECSRGAASCKLELSAGAYTCTSETNNAARSRIHRGRAHWPTRAPRTDKDTETATCCDACDWPLLVITFLAPDDWLSVPTCTE